MSRIKTFLRNINYLTKHSLWDQREEDIVYLTNKILDDGFYEYNIDRPGKPFKFLNKQESLDLLIKHPKSYVRLNDGEIKIIMGMDQPFQKYDKEIADRFIKLLTTPRDDLYVCINRNYFIPSEEVNDGLYCEFIRRYGYDYRKVYYKYCNRDTTFLDCTFPSLGFDKNGTKEADEYYAKLKSLFDNKKLCLVIGKGILNKVTYNIFKDGKDIIEIDAPNINAWDKHEQIIHDITTKASKDYLVVFCLGMAGKAMIPELTDKGYVCLDVGHLVKYYDEACKKHVLTKEERDRFYSPD